MNTALDFEALYQNYQASIRGFIRRRVFGPHGSNELVDDLCQDVFRKALEAIHKGVEVEHVSGWLFEIARNHVIDYLRLKRRKVSVVNWDEVWHEPAREPTPYEQAEQAITRQRVRRAVSKLRDSQRIVIARKLDGYELDEIAAEMDKPFGAVKALQHRGYDYLRIWLKEVA